MEKETNTFNLKFHEKKLIDGALLLTKGNRRAAALLLGISERTLYRKLSEYKLS